MSARQQPQKSWLEQITIGVSGDIATKTAGEAGGVLGSRNGRDAFRNARIGCSRHGGTVSN